MKVSLQSAGSIESGESAKGDGPDQITRPAMMVYAGKFESMDGEVEVTDEHIEKLHNNFNSYLADIQLAADGQVPAKKCPPVQLDHSQSAKDTVGRLVGPTYIGEYTNKEGKKVKALYTKGLRFLGKENVDKVNDGRWSDLSIGADLEEGNISEISVTPFPAAQGSALLKTKPNVGGAKMGFLAKLRAFLKKKKKMTEEEADKKLEDMDEKEMKKLQEEAKDEEKMSNAEDLPEAELKKFMEDEEKMRSYLMEKEEMEEDDAKEKLAGMDDEEKKELARAACEDEKKMAGEKDDDELSGDKDDDELEGDKDDDELSNAEDLPESKLKGKKKQLTKLAKSFNSTSAKLSIEIKKTQLTARLGKLRASGKVTPAEIKKIDIAKLASKPQDTINEVFTSYENREPQIMPGIYGSAKAVNLAEIQGEAKKARLEAETRKNMTLKKGQKDGNTQTANDIIEQERAFRLSSFGAESGSVEEVENLMESGDIKGAKVALRKVLKQNNDSVNGQGNDPAQLSALAEEFEKLQNQFRELLKLVGVK